MADVKLCECLAHLFASSYRFRGINVAECNFVQLRHSMANVKIYKSHFLHVLFFTKVELVPTILTDRQINTDTETGKLMAIGEYCRFA